MLIMKRYLIFAAGPEKGTIYRELTAEEYEQDSTHLFYLPVKYNICPCCGKPTELYNEQFPKQPKCSNCHGLPRRKFYEGKTVEKIEPFKVLEYKEVDYKGLVYPQYKILTEVPDEK